MFRVFGGHGEKPHLVVLDSLSLIDIIQEKYEEEFMLKPIHDFAYHERLMFKPTKKELKSQRGWDKK